MTIKFAPRITHKGFMPLFKDNTCFIKIPKVGSTTSNIVLRDGLSWERVRSGELDEAWEFVALVRHPIDRWLSGMSQWMAGGQRGVPEVGTAIKRMIFDVHTTPQSWWLEGVTPKLFRLENIQDMWNYFGVTTRVHLQKRRGPTLAISPEHKKRILDFYADDLKLWEIAQ